jgi:hypothetical protein
MQAQLAAARKFRETDQFANWLAAYSTDNAKLPEPQMSIIEALQFKEESMRARIAALPRGIPSPEDDYVDCEPMTNGCAMTATLTPEWTHLSVVDGVKNWLTLREPFRTSAVDEAALQSHAVAVNERLACE